MLSLITFCISLISFVAVIILGILAYRFRTSYPPSKFFLIYVIAISFWIATVQYSSLYQSLWSIRISMFTTAFMTFCQYLFIRSFFIVPGTKNYRMHQNIAGAAIALLILSLLPLGDLSIFTEVTIEEGNVIPIAGMLMPLFAGFFIWMTAYDAWLLYHMFYANNVAYRAQAPFLFFGLIISYSFIIFFDFIVVIVWRTTDLMNIGTSAIVFFVAATAYAMTRYRFLNITLAIQKTSISIFVILLWTIIYSGFTVFLFSAIYRFAADQYQLFFYILCTLVFHFIVTYILLIRLRRFLQTLHFQKNFHLHKQFFYNEMEIDSTHEMRTFAYEYAGMVQKVTEAPVQCLYILQEPYDRYVDFLKTKNRHIYFDEPIIHKLNELPPQIMIDALVEYEEYRHLVKLMQKMGVKMLLVIHTPQRGGSQLPVGLIGVGEHKNKRDFMQRHIEDAHETIPFAQKEIADCLYWQYTNDSIRAQMHDRVYNEAMQVIDKHKKSS